MLVRIFPFLGWFRGYDMASLRSDAIAGLTVALVLIPQSMAYAQLAGMPPYYGLYASFLPPLVAALFGSSRQLATGPVAVVSLMTSASLAPLATAGSEGYIAYAILLALLVGVFQFLLGVLRLGAGGQLPVPPRGQRLHQRRRADHRLLPAVQDVRGQRGRRRALLRDHHTGGDRRGPPHPLADPVHGSGRLRHHVRAQKAQPAHPQRPGGGGGDHGRLLGHRLRAQRHGGHQRRQGARGRGRHRGPSTRPPGACRPSPPSGPNSLPARTRPRPRATPRPF